MGFAVLWERKSLVSGLWRRHREVMSRGSGVCSHVAPGVCSSFAIRDLFYCRRMPLPKSPALLATSPVLSTSEAAVSEESGGAEIDAVFVFFIQLGAGKVALAVVDKKGMP